MKTIKHNLLNKTLLSAGLILAHLSFSSASLMAHEDKAGTPNNLIKTVQVADGIYVLYGQGGNIGLSIGEDGAYLIDDQYANMADSIKMSIAELTDQPVKFVINTHWHGDHSGSNLAQAKAGSVIVSHDNVRTRMKNGQKIEAIGMEFAAADKQALPVVTYNDQMSLHLNNDDMRIYHVEHAHTDGDSIVHLKDSNVIHMGDTFFNGGYPFIDLSSGGSIGGYIGALKFGLSLANDETVIIPGHGMVTDKAGMATYISMLEAITENVSKLKAQGLSLEDTLSKKPTAEQDVTWGKGFIKPKQIVTFIYNSL